MAKGFAPRLLLLLLSHSACFTYLCPCLQTQVAKGFARVEARLEDAALDMPRAPELFKQFKQQAQEGGWLA